VSEDLERLGRQLAAIDLAISRIRTETEPKERARLLEVVQRATDAAHIEYDSAVEAARQRPALRILHGGLPHGVVPAGAGMVILAAQSRRRSATRY